MPIQEDIAKVMQEYKTYLDRFDEKNGNKFDKLKGPDEE